MRINLKLRNFIIGTAKEHICFLINKSLGLEALFRSSNKHVETIVAKEHCLRSVHRPADNYPADAFLWDIISTQSVGFLHSSGQFNMQTNLRRTIVSCRYVVVSAII